MVKPFSFIKMYYIVKYENDNYKIILFQAVNVKVIILNENPVMPLKI